MSAIERTLDVDDLDMAVTLAEWQAVQAQAVNTPAASSTPAGPVQATERPWETDRACAGVDPGVFYPDVDPRVTTPAVWAHAKALCDRCPVADACLAWALDHNERYGMWGGTTPAARLELGYRRPCVICATPFRGEPGSKYCGDDCRHVGRLARQARYVARVDAA